MTEKDDLTWDRRRFLQVAGATAGTGLLAGCSSPTDQEFIADEVVLPEESQDDLGFTTVAERTERREISRTIGGQEVTATLESAIAAYIEADTGFKSGGETEQTESGDDMSAETFTGGQLMVGVLSTPAAKIAGQSLNPLASLGLGELLTSSQVEKAIGSTGAGEGGSVDWRRGPEQLSTVEGTLLDQDVTVETHAGIVEAETPKATYLHMARVANDSSIVIAVGIQGFDAEDTSKPFLGSDGYMTEAELADAQSTVVDVDAALVVN